MSDKKINLLGYSLESLEAFFADINEPKFRAKQLIKWIHQKGVLDFSQMTDFNKILREKLELIACLKTPVIEKVYKSFSINVENGGVNFIDESGNIWIEEYIMKKEPTHILNGFIWGLWGIYDYWLLTNDKNIKKRFDKYIKTINENIEKYDIGYWSLYELSDKPILMRASIFYHKLHIIQLKILYLMTDNENFNKKSEEWSNYLGIKYYRFKATFMKILFKIFYY